MEQGRERAWLGMEENENGKERKGKERKGKERKGQGRARPIPNLISGGSTLVCLRRLAAVVSR